MSHPITEDCSSGLHDHCTPCQCPCHLSCECKIVDRNPNEDEREWFKRWMCMYHWMQTNYYQEKTK